MQRIRLLPHAQAWSEDAWALAREAARIRPGPDLQSHAAPTLAGLDARKIKTLDVAAGALAFDPDPKHPGFVDRRKAGAVSVWDDPIGQPRPTATPRYRPVRLPGRRHPVQLARTAPTARHSSSFEAKTGRPAAVPAAGRGSA